MSIITESAPDLLAYAAARVPWLRKPTEDPRREPEPGRNLLDPQWLTARIHDTARRWESDATPTNATLWWYATAYRLIGVGVATALVTDRAIIWEPSDEIWLRPNGYFGGFAPHRWVEPSEYGQSLARTLAPVVKTLSAVGEIEPDVAWRLCADAVASRSLTAAPAIGSVARCSAFAKQVIAGMNAHVDLAEPVFVDQVGYEPAAIVSAETEPVPDATRTALRTECCQLHTTPGHARCKRCPARRRRL